MKPFLAIEFASSGVKLVKMKTIGNEFHLLQARSIPVPPEKEPEKQMELWKGAAREILSGEDLGTQTVLLSVNSMEACFSQFALPKLSRKELLETLKWKMKDELSFPFEEAVLDFRLFEAVKGEREPVFPTLVSALPQPMVDRHSKVLREIGCEEALVAQSLFSISDLGNTSSTGKPSFVAVVDLGHSIAEIALYTAGRLGFLRKIAFGGEILNALLTQPLVTESGTLSLTLEEAERAKREKLLLDPNPTDSFAGKVEVSKLHALIRPELEKLVQELERSLRYYAEEQGGAVRQIFLTGGTSRLRGLCEYLQKHLEIPTKLLLLEQNLKVEESLQGLDLSPFYRLIGAVLDRHEVRLPLYERLQRAERFVGRLSYKPVAVGSAIFILVLYGLLNWHGHRIVQITQGLKAQVENLKPGYETAEKIRTKEEKIQRGEILRSVILEKEPLWKEVFTELASALPEKAIFESVSYAKNALVIKGKMEGAGEASVSDLVASLEGPIFRKVRIINTERREGSSDFTIHCFLS